MNYEPQNIDDLFEAITFKPPSSLLEMKAFYELYKNINSKYTFNEILEFIGITEKKRQSFKFKMIKGFTLKELQQCLKYLSAYTTEIRSILHVFEK